MYIGKNGAARILCEDPGQSMISLSVKPCLLAKFCYSSLAKLSTSTQIF